ncbi:MAG: ATP-binding protein [Desulfobacteraceae bacterium]|nr:ATP-binding protein [Desulfobacteraceae bacterium]
MPEIKSAAKIEHLERLIEFVAGHAEMAGFTVNRINEIELAAEEALVNIFQYAYPGIDGDVVLDCRSEDEVGLILEISDNGAPFNILDVPDPDVTADISDREIGGLGVFFIKKMVDEAQYRRKGNSNILTLVFRKE